MTLRIAHASDIHWTRDPPLRRIPGKRVLGAASLYLRGRRYAFPESVQRDLVQAIVQQEPDAVFLTGDLTATALPAEFDAARAALSPLLDHFPTLILPGNHDVYTQGAARSRRFHETFGPWSGLQPSESPIARMDVGPVTLLGLDPCRPHPVLSSGILPQDQLDALGPLLEDLTTRTTVLGLHYPVLDRHGAIYDGLNHGLRNASALVRTLQGVTRPPVAILHGHEHHGYTVDLPLGSRSVPLFDCGSSGYALRPDLGRAAAFCIYTITSGALTHVARWLHTRDGFAPEPGGAYVTGR